MKPPASPQVVKSAAALIIGAELLSGKIRDENLYALSQTLRALGIELRRVIFCPDERDIIASDIRALRADHDVVFTSGGVGPTHDDVTIDGIATALGVPTVESSELATIIDGIYKERSSETHRLMARIPEGAWLAQSDFAGRPARWPTIVAQNVWIFPGVPQLFKMKLGVLRTYLRGPEPFFSEVVLCRDEEADIKADLDRIVSDHPEVEVGSYPKWFEPRYKTSITLDAREESQVKAAAKQLRELLGARVVTLD